MGDMVGLADVLPAMSEATRERLDRALAEPKEPTGGRPALIAKRDALLELARYDA
jgi:beta-N-acetylhexosaminidase